jgi:hypothetical protein
MKICPYMVTPSMRCTEREGHSGNHNSNGVWIDLVEVLQYAIGVMKKNDLRNSALYIEDRLKKFGL